MLILVSPILFQNLNYLNFFYFKKSGASMFEILDYYFTCEKLILTEKKTFQRVLTSIAVSID
jgi:hypothetical protein